MFGNEHQTPYFIRPDGTKIELAVENYVPYLYDNGTLMTEAPSSYQTSAECVSVARPFNPSGDVGDSEAESTDAGTDPEPCLTGRREDRDFSSGKAPWRTAVASREVGARSPNVTNNFWPDVGD